MRRRLTTRGKVVFAYFGILVIAVIVGIIVPGGTGDTILEISIALLALSIFATVGIGKAAGDAIDRRGRGL